MGIICTGKVTEYLSCDCRTCEFKNDKFMINGSVFCEWLSDARVLLLSSRDVPNLKITGYPYWHELWEIGFTAVQGADAFKTAELDIVLTE